MFKLHEKNIRERQVLLVEDNPGDVLLMQQAFMQSKFSRYLQVASDGDSALKMLRQEAEYSQLQRADVVLLDLNMPGKSGYDVLKEIKQDKKLKTIPVVVLSSSGVDADINEVYRLHGNSYIIKPESIEQYRQAVESFEGFWFEAAKLAS